MNFTSKNLENFDISDSLIQKKSIECIQLPNPVRIRNTFVWISIKRLQEMVINDCWDEETAFEILKEFSKEIKAVVTSQILFFLLSRFILGQTTKMKTSLIIWIVTNYPDSCRVLDSKGNVCLHYAICHKKSAVEAILQGFPEAPMVINEDGLAPIHQLLQVNYSDEILSLVLRYCPNSVSCVSKIGYYPLHYCCKFGSINGYGMKALIKLCPQIAFEKITEEKVLISLDSNDPLKFTNTWSPYSLFLAANDSNISTYVENCVKMKAIQQINTQWKNYV